MRAFEPYINRTKDVLRFSREAPVGVFALNKESVLVHVDEVLTSCKDLFCPDCGEEVRPRKCGENRRDHFFHLRKSSCGFVGESVLHKMAKLAFVERSEVFVPRLCVSRPVDGREAWEIYEKGVWRQSTDVGERTAVRSVGLCDVQLEQWSENFRPDVSAYDVKGRNLYLELKVTHKVSEEKKRLLQERGVSTLEIDLTQIPKHQDLSWSDFCDWVVAQAPREWVYNAILQEKLERVEFEIKSDTAAEVARSVMKEFKQEMRACERAMELVHLWSAPVDPAARVRGTQRHEKLQEALMRHVSSVSVDICVFEHPGSLCDESAFVLDDDLLFLEVFDICVVKSISRYLDVKSKQEKAELSFVTSKSIVGQLQRNGRLKDGMVECHGEMLSLCKEVNRDFVSPFEKVEMILKKLSAFGFLRFEKEGAKGLSRYCFEIQPGFLRKVKNVNSGNFKVVSSSIPA